MESEPFTFSKLKLSMELESPAVSKCKCSMELKPRSLYKLEPSPMLLPRTLSEETIQIASVRVGSYAVSKLQVVNEITIVRNYERQVYCGVGRAHMLQVRVVDGVWTTCLSKLNCSLELGPCARCVCELQQAKEWSVLHQWCDVVSKSHQAQFDHMFVLITRVSNQSRFRDATSAPSLIKSS